MRARAFEGWRSRLLCALALLPCALWPRTGLPAGKPIVERTAVASHALGAAEAAGEQIYRSGALPSGALLTGVREPGLRLQGATAACVNCHRRSGLGMSEGRRTIPPIAGSYLFHPRAGTVDDLDLPFVEGMQADHELRVDIQDFSIAADSEPVANVTISAKIFDNAQAIKAAKVFKASIPVKEMQANAAAAALDQAFGRVATDIVVWTLGQI